MFSKDIDDLLPPDPNSRKPEQKPPVRERPGSDREPPQNPKSRTGLLTNVIAAVWASIFLVLFCPTAFNHPADDYVALAALLTWTAMKFGFLFVLCRICLRVLGRLRQGER
jgi:hypothetical protein